MPASAPTTAHGVKVGSLFGRFLEHGTSNTVGTTMSTARGLQDYLGAVAQAERRGDANAYHYALVELGACVYALNGPALARACAADACAGRDWAGDSRIN